MVEEDEDTDEYLHGIALPTLPIQVPGGISDIDRATLKAQLKEQHALRVKELADEALKEREALKEELEREREKFLAAGGEHTLSLLEKKDEDAPPDPLEELKAEHSQSLKQLAEHSLKEKQRLQKMMEEQNTQLRNQIVEVRQSKAQIESIIEDEKDRRRKAKEQMTDSHKTLIDSLKSFQIDLAYGLATANQNLPDDIKQYTSNILAANNITLPPPPAPAPVVVQPEPEPIQQQPAPAVLPPRVPVIHEDPIAAAVLQGQALPPPSSSKRSARPGSASSRRSGFTDDDPPDDEEIEEYARYLGIDVVNDKDLLYIAEKACRAPLSAGWEENTDASGTTFYYHHGSGLSTYEHPMDEHYRQLYREKKKKKEAKKLTQ